MVGAWKRDRQPELMDQPTLDPGEHRRALAGLRRINQFSRASTAVWNALLRLAEPSAGPLRVLDLACGGGDIVIDCALRARSAGREIEFHGCDRSATAVATAQATAKQAGAPQVSFSMLDVTHDDLPSGYDVVICTLFLHHLAEDVTVQLLRCMAAAARRTVIVDDLRRSRRTWVLAWLGCQLLTRSPVVHFDGPRSVKAAYTISEMREICARAGLTNVAIHRHWPARFLMQWTKS